MRLSGGALPLRTLDRRAASLYSPRPHRAYLREDAAMSDARPVSAPEPHLDRRAFLKTSALALSSAALWACGRDLPVSPRGPGGEEGRFFFASGIENSYPLLPNGRRI